ncbi:MAG TPA: FCD domain-containing protein [Bryobacteraceae bacterium]|nr:hypothetical protein [Bryobacterales bacterium]HRJ17893.1 FCD domain-containing protein [Bryobacteraceae bacterium]
MTGREPILGRSERLHSRITRALALEVVRSSRAGKILQFPKESDLCGQLSVSRSILRESMKVLSDKGLVEMKPRAGTRARAAEHWNRMDPDLLVWQAELGADASFLQQLCEVRLAIEPTAAGFAAVRASGAEIAAVRRILEAHQARSRHGLRKRIEFDLDFQSAVMTASHSPMLQHLAASIRQPFRLALESIPGTTAELQLSLEAHARILRSLERGDAIAARRAAEEVVGFAMMAAESALGAEQRRGRRRKERSR